MANDKVVCVVVIPHYLDMSSGTFALLAVVSPRAPKHTKPLCTTLTILHHKHSQASPLFCIASNRKLNGGPGTRLFDGSFSWIDLRTCFIDDVPWN